MALLRQIRPTYKLFGEGIVYPRRDNVPTFRIRFATTFSKQQQQKTAENEVRSSNGDSQSSRPAIDETTIRRIEKLALVGFEYRRSKRVLEEAVAFAERLRTARIDETVRPMYSTLENDCIHLRDDVARHNVDRREILRNAAVLEDEYFVAPLTTSKERENESKR